MKARQTLTAKQLQLSQSIPQRKAVSIAKMNVPIVGKVKGCRAC